MISLVIEKTFKMEMALVATLFIQKFKGFSKAAKIMRVVTIVKIFIFGPFSIYKVSPRLTL